MDQWDGTGKGWEQGALEHGKKICSSSSPTRCSKTNPADKNEKSREKKKLRKPGCHKLIKDYDVRISYTPGKGNVMADALSHKSYCNNLML